ncbi:MAG: YARHG domain-containing protein [Fluviicola sp.]
MKKITLLLSLILISGIVFIACDSSEKTAIEETTTSENAETTEVKTYTEDLTAIERRYFDRAKKMFTPQIAATFLKIEANNKNVNYFSPTMHGILFLKEDHERKGEDDIYSYGLLDQNGKTLLKTDYERIGNPGFYGDQLVETKKDGKYGLFNYTTKNEIEAKYEYLIPSNVKEYIAFGFTKGKIMKIRHNGEEREYRESDKLIDFFAFFESNLLAKDNKNWCPWLHTSSLEYEREFPYYNSNKESVMFIPSFVGSFKCFYNDRNYFTNEDEAKLKISTKKEGDDFYSFVTNLYTMTTESRGAEDYEAKAYSVNKKTQERKSYQLYHYSSYSTQHCEKDYVPMWKWRNDSVIEVREWTEFEEKKDDILATTKVWALLVSKNGKMTPITNGKYAFASVFLLKPADFKGCFVRTATFEEYQQSPLFDPEFLDAPIGLYTNHLSIEELELMKNEIYARHGKEFTGKMKSYFKQQSWYEVRSEYSEKDITDIEKKNIALINQMIAKLKKQGTKLLNPHVEFMYEAG